jgi:hypothetical protein
MAVFTKRRPADSPVPKGALIAIPIFLVAGFLGTAALLRFISLSTLKTPFGWADVNVLFTWYRIFGYKDHAVPDVRTTNLGSHCIHANGLPADLYHVPGSQSIPFLRS